MLMNLDQIVSKLEIEAGLASNKSERARCIFDWMQENISYDYTRRDNLIQGIDLPPQTPEETLQRRQGTCGDHAILYSELGRRLRIDVDYAVVDCEGKLNHAINIVKTEKGPIQVDTTNGIFGANYKNYRITHIDSMQEVPARQVMRTLYPERYYQRGCSWLKSALVAAGIGAVVAVGAYFVIPMLKNRNVQYIETNESVKFTTKNGNLEFTLDPGAKKLVKEAFFYTEAIEGDAKDKELLAPYVTADVNGDNHFTKEEAKDARDRARADYLRSLR